jgi:hypothetical protein
LTDSDKSLRSLIVAAYSPQFHKLVEEQDAALLARHRTLVDKFLEVAERKVRIVDDYGDENWGALDQEVERCVLKIVQIEGDDDFRLVKGERTFKFHKLPLVDSRGVHYGWSKYGNLCRRLKREFGDYHNRCKAHSATKPFDELSGGDFEVYLVDLLKRLGFENVTRTPVTRDQGADLLATRAGRRIAIQANRYKGSVGNAAVQEIVGALKFYNAEEGWVITSGTFTPSARALAQVNNIRLIGGVELQELSGRREAESAYQRYFS